VHLVPTEALEVAHSSVFGEGDGEGDGDGDATFTHVNELPDTPAFVENLHTPAYESPALVCPRQSAPSFLSVHGDGGGDDFFTHVKELKPPAAA